MKPVHLGVDIGGHSVKIGVVDANCNILFQDSIPTNLASEGQILLNLIADKCREILNSYPVEDIGIGIPGTIDRTSGRVTAANLPFQDTPVLSFFQSQFDVPVSLENDANCAAFGQCMAGIQADSLILVTLGTGIGGGIILHQKIYTGADSNAGEFGHMIIHAGGTDCACGQKGCWETYASTAALCRIALKAAQSQQDSVLAGLIRNNHHACDGKLIVAALDQDCTLAQSIFETYLDDLAVGLNNLYRIFRPEALVLAGGISRVGDRLLLPLKRRLGDAVPLHLSKLHGNAGTIGASQLYRLKAGK